ncbi:MAG: hypothetical protein RSH78_00900 [Bacilli bacterium]
MKATGNNNDEEALSWFREYYKDKEICYAIEIVNPVRYKNPISLYKIIENKHDFKAPQNFIYVNKDDTIDKLIKATNLKLYK